MPTESLNRFGVLFGNNVLQLRREPGPIISYLLLPMVIMLMFKPIYTRAFGTSVEAGTIQVVTGPLIMFSVFTLVIIGNSILTEREFGTWDRLRASSTSATEMLLSKVVLALAILIAQQVLLLAYGCLVIGLPLPRSAGLVLLAILVWGFALVALGGALATIMRSHAEVAMISDLGAIVISAMGGALVPVSMMPVWAQFVAHLSPGYWALSMLQAAVRGDVAGTLGPAAVLVAGGIAVGAFAVHRIIRGWSRSTALN